MEPRRIYDTFFAWHDKREGAFPAGKLLCDMGIVVVEPFDAPDVVVKFTAAKIREGTLQQEFHILKAVERLELENPLYGLPVAHHYNRYPEYLVMSNAGPSYNKTGFTPHDIQTIGIAAGTFSAELFEKAGAIHNDFYWNNFTRMADGRVGIIDMASLELTNQPERMLPTALIQKGPLAQYIGQTFTHLTGTALDLVLARDLCRPENWPRMKYWKAHDVAWAKTAEDRIEENLAAWLAAPQPEEPKKNAALLPRPRLGSCHKN